MSLLRNLYHLLPTNTKTLIRKSDHALTRHLQVRNHPSEQWYDEYLQFLLFTQGTSHFITAREAVTSWKTGAPYVRHLTAFTRLQGSSDLPVLRQVWEELEYKTVVEFMLPYVDSTASLTIIDAGANVGYSTLYLKSAFPNARIVCLEPDSGNFRQLSRNIQINGFQDVEILQAGLWKSDAFLEVCRDVGDGMEWSFYVREVANSSLRGYSTTSLAAQRNWPIIDLLKIDIEGGERYVLENEELARQVLHNTRFIAIEVHDIYKIRPQIYELLCHNGIEFFEHGELTIGRNTNLT